MTIGNAAAVLADGTRTRIISSDADQKSLDIYGDRIVWADNRNEADRTYYWDSSGNWDIYMYDLSASEETQITSDNSTQLNPVLSGDRIVWEDNRNGNWDIYMYDLPTSTETRITSNKSNQKEPAIYGNIIVWQDDRNGNSDIYMYDLSTSKETRISTNETNQSEPAVYGDKIVWVDELRIDDPEIAVDPVFSINNFICVYDMSTSTETQLPSGFRMWNPSIYRDIVVWDQEDFVSNNGMVVMYNLSTSTSKLIAYERTADPDIYEDRIVWTQDFWDFRSHILMYNISTSTETEITADGVHELGSGSYPAIYGDKIVWVPSRLPENLHGGIYMFTLASSESPVDNYNKENGTETQIAISPSFQSNPAIYEDRVVWEDNRNGNFDIYLQNLSTHKETQITNDSSDDGTPAIYDDKMVWVNGNAIYNYNISTSTKKEISDTVSSFPAIYMDRIVWGANNIYMYDLSTSKKSQISTSNAYQDIPAIYEDRVVWHDSRNGNDDIFIYNLSTSRETQVTINNSSQRIPVVYEDVIVWEDDRNGNWDIYMYNLSTSTATQITTNEYNQGFPAVYKDRIIWLDDRSGRCDIYMYNLTTSRETRITFNGSVDSNLGSSEPSYACRGGPAICGNRIVWEDIRNGNHDIFMFTFPGSETTPVPEPVSPVANFSASPLSGKTPLKVKFTSTSTGSPTSWKWNFGDGSDMVFEQNPEHTYSTPGIYTVKHTAINAYGRDTAIKTNYIRVEAVPPRAAFSASPTSGYTPLKVTFADKSTGSPVSWKWSFGDGTYSTSKNPVHTYGKAGKYTVSLTVRNAAGSNTATKSGLIVANVLKAPVAAFSAAPTSGKAPLKVQFTDKSTNFPTLWKWSFGDGTYSTQKNPAHTYSKAGKYTVALTAKNAKGSSTKTISRYIVTSYK